MMVNFLNKTCLNYKEILIDEIALEGLEGIGIKSLWNRMSHRISFPLTDKIKSQFWETIINIKCIEFYILAVPVVEIKVINRFSLVDESSGHIKDPDECLDGPYEYYPVEHGDVRGSCQHYQTRSLIAQDDIKKYSYEDILKEHGESIVMVASQEERWHALASHLPISYLDFLTPVHYCILELVGKSRDNGQMTIGTTNLMKIIKDSKLLFYNRKHLQKLDLLSVVHTNQMIAGKSSKSILLRLKRFHKPKSMTGPTHGVIHNVIEYLKTRPKFKERVDVLVQKSLVQRSKIKKRFYSAFNVIKEEVPLSDTEPPQKKKKLNRSNQIKFVSLPTESDESSASDNENENIQLKCQYKVKVNLLRQAYERFIDAGLKGLTQIELGQVLGVEFYTSRAICQTLKTQNIVREFLEDKGRQRFSRFIAIAATGTVEKKYAAEKKKFLEYLDAANDLANSFKTDSVFNVEVGDETNNAKNEDDKTTDEQNKDITEFEPSSKDTKSSNESLFSVKKGPTLKQLQFANGIIKVLREKLTVIGYHTLNKIVSRDIDQPPMDNKSLKRFVQNLAAHGQLRIYKLNWPGYEGQCSIMICAPHITKSHPTVTAAYKEIHALKALRQNDDDEHKTEDQQLGMADDDCIISFKTYPRYKKAQKLHEFVFNLVYENVDLKMCDSYYPYGCISLLRIIPEMPAALALGFLSPNNITDIKIAKKHEPLLALKLSEVPGYIRKAIVNSKCLVSNLKNNFKILASFGLVQLCEPCYSTSILDYNNRPSNKYVIYVNRHAILINTTGAWPREGLDPKSLQIKFYLQNSTDVKKYWATLYDISTNTTITRKRRQHELPHIPTRSLDQLTLHDNGNVFGDGLGPAGFDSIYLIDKPRQWQDFNIFKYKKILKPVKKLPESKVFKTIIKKKIKIKPKKTTTIRQKSLKISRVLKNQNVRNKVRNTMKWTKWEDDIITMVMAARMIMSPNTQPGSLQVSNYVAKDIISIRYSEKTGTHCHKRALALEKSTLANRERIVNELRRKRHLIAKYEGLLKKIRLKYSTNLAKYLNEARLRMMELIWIIVQVIKSKSFGHKVACVSKDIDDFHKKFSITTLTEKKNANTYLKQNDSKDPVRVSTIVEAILQTVNSITNEEFDIIISDTVYSIFSNYPEETLRIALEQVKKSGAVAARDKFLNNHFKFGCNDITQYTFSFRISAAYERRWSNRLNTSFIIKLADAIEQYRPTNNIEGSPELCCVLFEQHSNDVINIYTHIKPSIYGYSEDLLSSTDTENKYKFKCGSTGWLHKDISMKYIEENYKGFDITKAVQKLISVMNTSESKEANFNDNDLLHYLERRGELGATYNELKGQLGYNSELLTKLLRDLENEKVIMRVGFYENHVILMKYVEPWSVVINDKHVIPAPWMTLHLGIKPTVFVNWTNTIMNKIFEAPGSSISSLSDICEFLSSKHVFDICTVLNDYQCVTLKSMEVPETTLFSDDNIPFELHECNPYDCFENTFVFPTKDCLSRYAILRKKLLNFENKNDSCEVAVPAVLSTCI